MLLFSWHCSWLANLPSTRRRLLPWWIWSLSQPTEEWLGKTKGGILALGRTWRELERRELPQFQDQKIQGGILLFNFRTALAWIVVSFPKSYNCKCNFQFRSRMPWSNLIFVPCSTQLSILKVFGENFSNRAALLGLSFNNICLVQHTTLLKRNYVGIKNTFIWWTFK